MMAASDSDMEALNGGNAAADHIVRAEILHLQHLHDVYFLQQEIGTKLYILHSLFGPVCPLVAAMSTEVVDHINAKFSTFGSQITLTSR